MLRYLWTKSAAICFLSLGLLTWASPHTVAETVVEKITRTGTLTAGTSKDALPFAYRNEQGQLVGYSVDILELVTRQLEEEYDQDIDLELVALEPKERIPQLMSGEVDIVCDASSFTWERDRAIDFSFSYGSTGTRLLTKRGNKYWDPQSLVGVRIGALAQTTNEQAIGRVQPQAEIVLLKDRAEGFTALREGKIDAFASDGILLESWLQKAPDRQNWQVVGDYSLEGIACMVAENNSQFLNTVNYTLVEFMQGLVDQKPKSVAIFDRWFGPQGALPLTKDLQEIMIDNIQLLIDFKERIVN